METINRILLEFGIENINNISRLNGGIIHKTWRIDSKDGLFVLQKVNPIYTPEVMEDINTVFSFLKNNGFFVASIVKTKNGALYVSDSDGFWRMFDYIDGCVYDQVINDDISYNAGKLLGSYHCILQKLNYKFKHVRPIKNNISALFDAYKKSIVKNKNLEIDSLIDTVDSMIDLKLPEHLRNTINHGDPKISNFIFEKSSTQAVTMVDFDDCGSNYNVLYELGSAFRSWSWNVGDKDNLFDLNKFSSGLSGYVKGSNNFLTEEEFLLIPQAIKVNILQLTSRFIRDYFEDCYFEWDTDKYQSRQEHNLFRAKEHIDLYNDVLEKEDKLFSLIDEIRHKTKV